MNDDIIKMAREAGFERVVEDCPRTGIKTVEFYAPDGLERFAELVRAEEREAISAEWNSCVYSDLEHGVKSLNEQAAKDWLKNYPAIAKFGAWLSARGNV
jgi:hypothetical protein